MSALNEILKKERIADFLSARGIEVQKAGSRYRCLCPLHKDTDPSFYIGQFPDGVDYFKCFGCGKSGVLPGLISELEKKTTKQVYKELFQKHGVEGGSSDVVIPIEPKPYEIMACFCEEDSLVSDIATYARMYLRARKGRTDAVNKVSRLYMKLDEMSQVGDVKGMHEILRSLKELMAREGKRMEERG
jgi:hypothetical protein